jgi:hypothetical protein
VANGAKGPWRGWYLVVALTVLVVLAATGVWNPFPNMWGWVNRSHPLSDPDVVWRQRVDGTPRSVTIAGNTVVVEQRTTVEVRRLDTGERLWEKKADWAAIAGGERDPVVAVGKLLVKGYELLDPETGAVRRRDNRALGVWTYRNALLDVQCAGAKDCVLTARAPRGTEPLWTTFLPGVSAGLLADNPEVVGTRPLTAPLVDAGAGGPETMPPLLGFPIDGRVHVVDTAAGRTVQDVPVDNDARVVVVGGRVLRVEARGQDGTCYFTILARDPVTGQEVWRRAGINLRTADGVGCLQRQDPQGGQNVVVGVGPDGRETVLDAYDGRLLCVGGDGEKLLAVDDRYALARTADQKAINGRELSVATPRWTRPVSPEGGATLTRFAAVIVDRKPDRIIVLDQRTGRELVNLRSSAKVLAVGPAGLVIGDGRDIGYARFGGSGAVPAGPDAGPGAGTRPGSGAPTCGGPKREQCPPPAGGKDG